MSPGPDWTPLNMRRWVAQDLHRTLTEAIDHLGTPPPGTGHLPGGLLDDLRYHAGLLRCRLAEPAAGDGTTTDKDPIR
ncbi:hypothetical protein [Actinomadura sp. 7K507]|uniref:hypothetical protein n=1 Tax=Actinomadura sp. 7K507 TaxID=2530365 RepID=UPI0010503113|nr:hypothetical protein [Actinomadura sp. 7K507]TDC73720.1 hypothetical protein E1285_44355 [Actinomadura sp. 7K507]